MIVLIIIFLIACCGIAALLSLKTYALRTGIEPRVLHIINHRSDEFEMHVRHTLYRTALTLRFVKKEISLHGIAFVTDVVGEVRTTLIHAMERMLKTLKGTGVQKKRGAASLFLKSIADHKEQIPKGRIEE